MDGSIALRGDGVRALVDVERGARLASLRVGGRELLIGPPDPVDRSIRWGLFLMAPWVGRLADGRLDWAGGPIQLRRNHGRHAIHGLVFDRPWVVDRSDEAACDLSVDLDRERWPFGGRVRQHIALGRNRLDLAAEIDADVPMPGALGWHPWFRRSLVDGGDGRAVKVRVAAPELLERRAMIPTGRTIPVSGTTDLRRGPTMGSRRLDDVYVGVAGSPVIEWPDLRLVFELPPSISLVTVYSPRHALCLEPQTAWPNALGLPEPEAARAGAAVIDSSHPLRAAWSMRWEGLP